MLAAIEMIRQRYGGPEGYLEAKCGLKDEDFEKIRANIDGAKDTAVDQKL